MSRWQPKRKPTAKQQQATRRTSNLANCEKGKHLLNSHLSGRRTGLYQLWRRPVLP